jgi:hypothetical protein
MRIGVGIMMYLSAVATVWANEPPPTAAPPVTPTDRQAGPASGQGKPTPAEAPSAAPAATPSAPAATATTNKPESAAATAHSPKTLGPDDEKNLLAHGYKIETKNGQKYFCHSETPTGTRFPQKTCRTEEQMAATRESSKDFLNDLQRPSGNGNQCKGLGC